MAEKTEDWRVDVKIDGVIRSFVYPSESMARSSLAREIPVVAITPASTSANDPMTLTLSMFFTTIISKWQ